MCKTGTKMDIYVKKMKQTKYKHKKEKYILTKSVTLLLQIKSSRLWILICLATQLREN